MQEGEEAHHEPEKVSKGVFAQREEQVLEFWNKQDIFKKSLEKPASKGEYVFYDGPPFATGLPHYGHLLQSALKDAIPRYRTMRGYHVARQWGWDCHGLPLENQIEQELGFKTKRDIEQFGVEKFNLAAQGAVLRYADEWRRIIPRIGRWADMENDYKTMDASYTESVWWAFKRLYDKKLLYEGFKAMHLCPRCGTTLSNFEVAQGYQDIDDIATTVKLPLVDEPETSLLIWTTTPWTLPGNTAAAVNASAVYVKVRTDEGFVVLAKDLAKKVLGDDILVYGEILGKDLVGKYYTPPFNYFADQIHKHKTHAWRVYAAPYVTLEDGTGIVHLAPAYGEEDLALAQKEKIPLIHHVTDEGKFVATVHDFANLPVKPKGRHTETDTKIADHLEQRGLLFKREKIKHSYPHCWRCDTPLLNWAANSWFVKVSAIKSKLLAQNAKVQWVPGHVGSGRFANLLANAPDWAISRSRYWGAPIPVWRHSKTKEIKVVGSVKELLSMVRRSGNAYFVMRHGEAQSNLSAIFDSYGSPENTLTQQGRQQVAHTASLLRKKKIDLIIYSPLLRTKETAIAVQKILGLRDSAMMVDERLREIGAGEFDGKSVAQWKAAFAPKDRFAKKAENAESYADVRKRVGELLFEVERRYSGKNILFVTHECPAWLLNSVALHKTADEVVSDDDNGTFLNPGTYTEVVFVPFPHNNDYELDLHRPYIDDVPMGNALKGEWKRVTDVFDCWFESGSMPYASNQYPVKQHAFNPKRLFGLFPKGYPADFIAEGIDQTRGWFYSLIVLSTALFGRSSYKAVVTNGLILAEDGRKMSKKLKNYPDPMQLVDTFGADALRQYLLSTSVIRGEDLRFSARGVEEVQKKLLMRLDNVRSFYELYATADTVGHANSNHVLDRWILSRLNELVQSTTNGFESYELDVATRPLGSFVDDLSTWYLRRSRDRFKVNGDDKEQALSTLRFVLHTTAHLMAPVMPFFADDLFLRTKESDSAESVHLSNWPVAGHIDQVLLVDMQRMREIASQALELRERAGIKIRQPLATLKVKQLPRDTMLHGLVADELNVKKVVEDTSQVDEVWLDVTLTPELKEEGLLRDLIRRVQEWRKKEGLQIADRPDYTLVVSVEEELVAKKYRTEIMNATGLARLDIHA